MDSADVIDMPDCTKSPFWDFGVGIIHMEQFYASSRWEGTPEFNKIFPAYSHCIRPPFIIEKGTARQFLSNACIVRYKSVFLGNHREKLCFRQDRDAQSLGFGQLTACFFPADQVVSLFRYRAARLCAKRQDLVVDL